MNFSEIDKLLNENLQTSLIDFGNNKILKSTEINQYSNEEDYLINTNLFDLVYVSKKYPGKYIIVLDKTLYENNSDYSIIGLCCVTGDQTEDGYPRFVYTTQDTGSVIAWGGRSMWGSYILRHPDTILNDNGWDGYSNCIYYSQKGKSNAVAIELCHKIARSIGNGINEEDLYIPALNELKAAIINKIVVPPPHKDIITSSLFTAPASTNDMQVYIKTVDQYGNPHPIYPGYSGDVLLPFINIIPSNLYI